MKGGKRREYEILNPLNNLEGTSLTKGRPRFQSKRVFLNAIQRFYGNKVL